MDAFNFINFLKNPGYLHQVTFQEINNLIEQYPFCQNLHYLALRKAQIEDHKDFVKKLELAATYSPNRQWLYKQLKDAKIPAAISDKEEETTTIVDPEEDHSAPSGLSIIDDAPSPSEEESTNELEETTVHEMIANNEGDLEENTTEETPISIKNTPIPSHSISDSDTDDPSVPTDDIDTNLENLEDMKLPDDKNKRVIYMEDLVDNMPPLENETTPIDASEQEGEDNKIETPDPDLTEEIPQEPDLSPSPEIQTPEVKDIPFEINDIRGLPGDTPEEVPELEVEDTEIAEAEIISDIETNLDEENAEEDDYTEIPPSEHKMDEVIEQADQEISPSESMETIFPVAMRDDEEESLEEHDLFEEEISGEEETENEEPPTVAPMPKSAFSSWRKSHSSISSSRNQEEKNKVKQIPVVAVNDLFKSEKKKKKVKKKKKKKKDTKRFAMESLLEHEDVISETLAEIIAEQGAKKKAIKMYKRLMKMHPEKYAIYMNRIEELSKE